MTKRGKFIAFEGIDGSGKSTQMQLLWQELETRGHKVYSTFEPTDNKIGSAIRAILKGEDKADERTIAALFAADRLHHILNENDGIIKKLNEGFIVLCDRFYFSSYAYHSVHMDMEWVIEINKKSAEVLRPDLNLFIDVSPEVAMKRIQASRVEIELYETMDILKKVYHNYHIAFDKMKNAEHIVTIEGNASTEVIAASIRDVLRNII
jgi:dTMP kinase